MIAKRLGAGLLAVLLILGAWVVRDRVIDDDGAGASSGDDDGGGNDDDRPGKVLYCVSELRDVCRGIETEFDSLDVRIENAGATLDVLATVEDTDAMWLTLAPLPEMAATLRRTNPALDPIEPTTTPVATSAMALVVEPDSTASLTSACGDPVSLACLADQAPLSPTFAPIDTAVGMLGVAAAAASFGGDAVDVNDVDFVVWGRRLAQSGATQLSGGTAIQTIQTRPSFAVAIGAEAELAATNRGRFDVLHPDQAVQLDVVLMAPEGVEVPSGLTRAATQSLTSAGWSPPRPVEGATGLPAPGVILAVRDIWEDLR